MPPKPFIDVSADDENLLNAVKSSTGTLPTLTKRQPDSQQREPSKSSKGRSPVKKPRNVPQKADDAQKPAPVGQPIWDAHVSVPLDYKKQIKMLAIEQDETVTSLFLRAFSEKYGIDFPDDAYQDKRGK